MKIKIFILGLLAACFPVIAQTTNSGEMIISSNTQVSTLGDFVNTSLGVVFNDGEFYIYRNFQNDGDLDFISGGLTRFQGFDDVQVISGLNRSYLYDAYFDNTTTAIPFHLSGTISIANESYFNNGIVDNEDYGGLFVFEQNGFHTSTSDDSHVDGYVLKEGNTEFKYPIGDGGYYRFASISEPEEASDGFKGKYYLENSDDLYPHSNKEDDILVIDNQEYWTIDRYTGNSEVLITLSWRGETTPTEITDYPDLEQMHIVRWDETEQLWKDEGGVMDVVNQTVTSVVTGYGVFTLARVIDRGVLPACVAIYNEFSPNGDGVNDTFVIECIDNFPNNTLKVYNRWGNLVYSTKNYNNTWTGVSDGRATFNRDEKLPEGTYYFVLDLGDGYKPVVKWLYINR